jgi:hypothetical protein
MKHRLVSVLLALTVLTSASVARGDATQDAREHFQRGTSLYDEQDYRGALAEFKRAYELAPNPTVLFNIGQAYYQLNEYANALTTLEAFLAEGSPNEARRAAVTKELEELRLRVARVEIDSNVSGAEISVDDHVVGPAPVTTIVAVGRRRITATKTGYAAVTQQVDFASGNAPAIKMVLAPSAPPTTPEVAQPTEPQRRPWPTGLVVGSFAVGVAGLATGTVFGIMALNDRSALDDRCTGKVCPEDARSRYDDLKRDGIISTIGFAVGGVGTLAGFYFALTSRGEAVRGSVGVYSNGTSNGVRGTF